MSKQFLKAYTILHGLNMYKTSVPASIEHFEEIIRVQFRVSMSVDEWVEAYEAGAFTKYLAGRKERLIFYKGQEWLKLKKTALLIYGTTCMACGSKKETSIDHIISRYNDKSKSLDINNLQVLCYSCNFEKSSSNMDYRKPEDIAKLEAYLLQQEKTA